MKLAIPLGLLGLIAIALLILIYVFKPKYQEKKVSSTYIWKLSLKYTKRKVPFQWLKSSVLLIIQILILAVIAFSMAGPQIVLASKSGEKIVILDASASMTAEYNGKSRFERAKSEIYSMIDETTASSHKISIILAGEKASYVVSRTDSAIFAKQKLFEAECSLLSADIPDAMEHASTLLGENPDADVYFFTDSDYADSGKVNVINVADSEWNAAVLNFYAKRENGKYVFTAEIASFGKSAEIAVNLKIDGKAHLPKLAECKENETIKIVWDDLDISTYGKAEIHIGADDSFAYDNDFYIYSDNNELFKVQFIVQSDDVDPKLDFLYSALRSTEKLQITTIRYSTNPEADIKNTAEEKSSGFDLYVYDNYVPEVLPKDGTAWLINPPEKLPASLELTVRGKRKADLQLTSSGTNSEVAQAILNGPVKVKVTEYTRITDYWQAGYESILSIDNDPALLVRNNGGLKTVVMPFNVHKSDLPIVPQFPLFINALCDYSMAYTLENTLYEIGDTIKINAKADTASMSVKTELNGAEREIYSSSPEQAVETVEIKAESAGLYTVSQLMNSGRETEVGFFVRVSESESLFNQTQATLVNPVTHTVNGTDTNVKNNTSDITVYFIGALLLLLCIEWGLQYREQY